MNNFPPSLQKYKQFTKGFSLIVEYEIPPLLGLGSV